MTSYAFAKVASRFGYVSEGLGVFFTTLVTSVLCAVIAAVTAWIFKRYGRPLSLRKMLVGGVLISFVVTLGISWLDTRQHLRIFLSPAPVPDGLHVLRGRAIMFESFVHFTAPPEVVASLLQTKGMVAVPDKSPDELPAGSDLSLYFERQRSRDSWDWWQPAVMGKPTFFYRHHQSQAAQGWVEGWWVNSATNEVYAFIGG